MDDAQIWHRRVGDGQARPAISYGVGLTRVPPTADGRKYLGSNQKLNQGSNTCRNYNKLMLISSIL